jgi:uncharacterized protein (DUF58 family)
MRPLVLLGVLTYGLILVGLGTLHGALLGMALVPIAYLAVALLDQPEKPKLQIERRLHADRVAPDTPIEVSLTVTNTGGALAELQIGDVLPKGLRLLDGTPSLLTSLDAGASVELHYTLSGPRGVYRFQGVNAIASDRLGLLSQHSFIEVTSQVFIVPEVVRLRHLTLRPRRTQIYSGTIPARQGGPGVEFFGLRAYQPGDPTRWLNGRASARHPGSLYVNEFEQERVTEIGIILDVRQRSNMVTSNGSLLEYSIQAAAALATGMLDQGNRVGLLLYGNVLAWTFPGYGKIQRERILRALAQAEAGDLPVFEDLDRIPTRLFPTRSLLILVSPLLSRDYEMIVRLRARGYQVLVVSPDTVSFERQLLGDTPAVQLAVRAAEIQRRVLLNKLRKAGIAVIDWDIEQPFQQVAAAAFGRGALHF